MGGGGCELGGKWGGVGGGGGGGGGFHYKEKINVICI